MASESESEKRETLADIVAEMRRGTKLPGYWRSCDLNKILKYHADRIEATWKREMTEAEANALAVGGLVEAERQRVVISKKETTTIGNAAALREAVVALLDALDSLGCDETTATLAAFVPDMADSSARCLAALRKAKDALSAPARNCDMCDSYGDAIRAFEDTEDAEEYEDMAEWLLALAAELKKEGKGDGAR